MPLAVAPAISPTFGFSEGFALFIATLIASERLAQADISAARDLLADAGCNPDETRWIDPEIAADLAFSSDLATARNVLNGRFPGIDVVCQATATRIPKLFIADMDSTMITVECLDELADYAGFKAAVAAITESAMRGEIDFAGALDKRVHLLKGLPANVITRCYEDRVAISPGAEVLVRTLGAHDTRTVLVSGGFTQFADRVAAKIGFDRAVSNTLGIADGALTGEVTRPLIDSEAKCRLLGDEIDRLGIAAEAAMAIGDGANDKAMIEAAGLGIAYRGKPLLRAAADACIDHNSLSALLYAAGIARSDWVAA